MKLCVDCKHYLYFNECGRAVVRQSPVNGVKDYADCSTERLYWCWFDKMLGFGWDACGPKAKYFEEKE